MQLRMKTTKSFGAFDLATDFHISGERVGIFGVSGSGKSTLVYDTLYQALQKKLYHSRVVPGHYKKIEFDAEIDRVVKVLNGALG